MRPSFHGVIVGTSIGVPQILSTERIGEKKTTAILSFSPWLRRWFREEVGFYLCQLVCIGWSRPDFYAICHTLLQANQR